MDFDKPTIERDELLLRLLKTPPQPRPKRGRGASAPTTETEPEQTITVYDCHPLPPRQFEARLTTLRYPIRSDGISVLRLRAEWLASLGYPSSEEGPDQP